jgi:hypothetical protein
VRLQAVVSFSGIICYPSSSNGCKPGPRICRFSGSVLYNTNQSGNEDHEFSGLYFSTWCRPRFCEGTGAARWTACTKPKIAWAWLRARCTRNSGWNEACPFSHSDIVSTVLRGWTLRDLNMPTAGTRHLCEPCVSLHNCPDILTPHHTWSYFTENHEPEIDMISENIFELHFLFNRNQKTYYWISWIFDIRLQV